MRARLGGNLGRQRLQYEQCHRSCCSCLSWRTTDTGTDTDRDRGAHKMVPGLGAHRLRSLTGNCAVNHRPRSLQCAIIATRCADVWEAVLMAASRGRERPRLKAMATSEWSRFYTHGAPGIELFRCTCLDTCTFACFLCALARLPVCVETHMGGLKMRRGGVAGGEVVQYTACPR